MNNYYKLYIENTYTLAETIVIKFEDAARALNLRVMADHGLNSVSPDVSTWKYYQNISGNYHFSDVFDNNSKVITITSLDTLEQIEFRSSVLENHPATKRAYLFGNRHYRQLIQKYPGYELLILGVLYPVDINIAISAKDGTILNYPKYLIDVNEYSLIDKLQSWIYKYVDRWINKQFAISDDLYVATYLGQLYLHLVPEIINLRLQACKTNEAHSFHIREYLASNGMLDKYLDVMTINQALFFYRNILYIERNAGKRDTFDWLVENLMTVRSLPLYDFTMKHDVDAMISAPTNEVLSLHPNITFRRNPINYKTQLDAPNSFLSLHSVNLKLKDLVPGNAVYLENNIIPIREKLEDSKSNVVGTKLLESLVSDYQLSTPYTLEMILLNHWLYWSSENIYNAYVSISFIKTKKIVDMSVKDAFILLIYVINRAIGLDLPNIPSALATRVLPVIKTDVSELRKMTDTKYVDQSKLDLIHSTVPTIGPIDSIDVFYAKCKLIYISTLQQYRIEYGVENQIERGEIQAAITRLYIDKKVGLGNESYASWFSRLGLDFTVYEGSDFYELYNSIITETTGVNNVDDLSIRKVQIAMVEMLQLLSSYSIEVVRNSSEPPIQVIPRPSVRVGDESIKDNSLDYVDSAPVFVQDIINSENEEVKIDINTVFPLGDIEGREHTKTHVDIAIDIKSSKHIGKLDPIRIHLANIRVVDRYTHISNKFCVPQGVDIFDIQTKDVNDETVTQQDIRIMDIHNTFMGGMFVADNITDVPLLLSGNPNIIAPAEFEFTAPTTVTETDVIYFSSSVFGVPENTLQPPHLVTENNKIYFTSSLFHPDAFKGKLTDVPIKLSIFNSGFRTTETGSIRLTENGLPRDIN